VLGSGEVPVQIAKLAVRAADPVRPKCLVHGASVVHASDD
jgi:hypothetical protein